jgi:hypothetical protein
LETEALREPAGRGRRLALVAVLAAVAAGSALRLWNLRDQVMAGDELHAVRAALARPVPEILFVYQVSDNCIPMTVYDRLLLDTGVRLTELLVRLPVIAGGLALLALGPWWAWRRLGPGAAAALAGLLAVSPALVIYARIARSYGPIALLGPAAVVAFEAWRRRGGWKLGVAFVACAALAVWFHLAAAPLVVAPFLATLPAIVRARGRGLWPVVALGLALALALLALLVPARETLVPLLESKSGELDVSRAELVELAEWLAGVRSPWLAAPVRGVVLPGAGRRSRRDAPLAGALGVAAVGQVAGILALAPYGHQSAVILARYLVPALPIALALAACAVGLPWSGRRGAVQLGLGTVAVVALFAAGPFTDPAWRVSSFAHTPLMLRFTAPRPTLPPGGPPAVYRWLSTRAPGPVVELPWHSWRYDRALPLYQLAHRRRVVVTALGAPFSDPRIAFRNMVPTDAGALLGSDARWLVVHRALVAEESRIGPIPDDGGVRRALREYALGVTQRLRDDWGAADYRDDETWCWDLERMRRGGARPRSPRSAR